MIKTNIDWTNVNEKLPDKNMDVMVMDTNGTTMLDHIDEQNNWNHNRIVYWMTLEDFIHNLYFL